MKAIKEKGVEMVSELKRHVQRIRAMERISEPDKDALLTRLDNLEKYIYQMQEYDADGEEIG